MVHRGQERFKPSVCVMNKTIGLQLVIYSLLLAGLSLLSQSLAPALSPTMLFVGLAGGALCLVWGIAALLGGRRKAWALLTLAGVNAVLLRQVVSAWSGTGAAAPGKSVAALATLLLLLSLAMLMRIAWAGAFSPEQQSPGQRPAGDEPTPAAAAKESRLKRLKEAQVR